MAHLSQEIDSLIKVISQVLRKRSVTRRAYLRHGNTGDIHFQEIMERRGIPFNFSLGQTEDTNKADRNWKKKELYFL